MLPKFQQYVIILSLLDRFGNTWLYTFLLFYNILTTHIRCISKLFGMNLWYLFKTTSNFCGKNDLAIGYSKHRFTLRTKHLPFKNKTIFYSRVKIPL
jgi:hypothetical protein